MNACTGSLRIAGSSLAATLVLVLFGTMLSESFVLASESANWSLRQDSANGLYEVFVQPETDSPPIGTMHRWILTVRSTDGEAIYPARISVGGGMRGHGHGLPTQPRVIAYGGDGDYLVDGIRFNMAGEWSLSFIIESDLGSDRVDFTFKVETAPEAIPSSLAWTDSELATLKSLSLASLGPAPAVPGNAFADRSEAVGFGKSLFFENALSGNGKLSCASCHQPARNFTDGRKQSVGIGVTMRNAPTVVGGAYGRWFYWDGRRDSLWSQALIPFEAADEMGGSRVAVVRTILEKPAFRSAYAEVFGDPPDLDLDNLPIQAGPFGTAEMRDAWHRLGKFEQDSINRVYANIGKAIAAYERTLVPQPTRFDLYVQSLAGGVQSSAGSQLTAAEIDGARLFLDAARTQCLQCHNGPLLTNGEFHNVGSGNFEGDRLDFGREFGLRAALMDEFNCLGPYSDAEPGQCVELIYLNKDSHLPLRGAFKVPTLRGLRKTAPYFHDGRFETLDEVLSFYNDPPSTSEAGPHELRPMSLTKSELDRLKQFLLTFSE